MVRRILPAPHSRLASSSGRPGAAGVRVGGGVGPGEPEDAGGTAAVPPPTLSSVLWEEMPRAQGVCCERPLTAAV